MAPLRVLICGTGIAGPILTYFLTLPNSSNSSPTTNGTTNNTINGTTNGTSSSSPKFQVTLLERSPSLRTAGQNIDIRGAGWSVIQQMAPGVESAIRNRLTEEEGMIFVDAANNVKATFPADKTGETQTFTSNIEILRGRLGEILFEAVEGREGVEAVFGDYVSELENVSAGEGNGEEVVRVKFAKSGETKEYDIVVAADGLGSKTRGLAWGKKEAEKCVRSLDMFGAFFSLAPVETDGTWCRWFNAKGRRTIMTRPDNEGTTRAFLSVICEGKNGDMELRKRLEKAAEEGQDKQKEIMESVFQGAGWETERLLKGMREAKDFYYDMVGQVKLDKWNKGRVVVLGDAGYCPSPISGMGTTCAIVGAYILAGELTSHPDDILLAFSNYDKLHRPLVEKAQALPPGAPKILNPETEWGLKAMHGVLGFVSWSGIATLAQKYAGPPAAAIELPKYEFAV